MNKKKIRILIIILILLLLSTIIITIVLNRNKNSKTPTVISIEIDEETQKELKKEADEALVKRLSKMSEQKRMEYYATEFIKDLEGRRISSAYSVLNEDFKKNFFNTEEAFKKYIEKYFPKETSVKYANMERLGNIYVLEVEIKDILTSKNPNNFNCYIVIKENTYANYELSFSVDSAMKNSENEESGNETENQRNELYTTEEDSEE